MFWGLRGCVRDHSIGSDATSKKGRPFPRPDFDLATPGEVSRVCGIAQVQNMKVRLAVFASLTCGILLLPGVQAQSPQQNQQQMPTEIPKFCSEKVPQPCVTSPQTIYAPSPEYSAVALNAHYQGVCVLRVIVEADGSTSHIRVISGTGMGLDEKAIEAVKRWKFTPALKDGKPVPVPIAIEISFSLPRHLKK